MKIRSEAVKEDLFNRLRRIEGQVRGVQRMLDDDRECREIVQQLNAIHAAVGNASQLFMRAYAKDCLLSAEGEERDVAEMIDELLDLMASVKAK